MLSGTSSFLRKRTGHKLTAIPACHKRRQSSIATRGAQLKSVKIKEKAEPGTPIASRFSLGCVDKKDTHCKRKNVRITDIIHINIALPHYEGINPLRALPS